MILVIDNYDSFTYNLVQYLGELGAEVEVVRNDKATVAELLERRPDRLVVSPGPCTPAEADPEHRRPGFAEGSDRRAGDPRLGHQAMVEAFGGRVVQGEPIHGKDGEVEHDGKTIFAGLPSPMVAGRYHSLVVDPDLPEELELTARLGEVVMGARHKQLPVEGVQFHPESVLTPQGKHLLANFIGKGDSDA
jgi:anthranilate synthase/aminodeoxychorismate synthase-like glutamine amidotransferase